MSALFARVVKQALLTFERENYPTFKSNFAVLKQLVDQLTSRDLNIAPELLAPSHFENQSNRAPVTYLEICEHKTFTMSVFILANKYTMPLHDHPGHGLLRVISGTARIQSYSFDGDDPMGDGSQIRSQILPVIEEPAMEFAENSECSVLTPRKCNIHEITASGNGSTAFFDILSPPYESDISMYGPKKCLFYRKIPVQPLSSSSNAEKTPLRAYLQRIGVPNHYYCDNIYYNPPEFLTNLNLLNSPNRSN